ncbi:Porphobilinogen deaminase [Corynebacterium ciconiae DSM 44920]|uniref:hydroxymethylbilane synthase n=1 Tax=Corynebacterium ciconiae TaxID=227319 RepID=UPI000363D5F2|nr:hydroxymethylbilane synthase [Corynebacterium ciconiae]WKD62066.1 Porphobilinogen deaminase [Corynebacterium ciconiae DSM 44920]
MFRIGTRGSQLATTQTGHVRAALAELGYDAELTIITTPGDKNMSPVERIGVGVFTQALREAMARGECDVAVHSFKDLPTARDDRFVLSTPAREDRREALIARDGLSLDELPPHATVGTSAPRRIAQLKALRPDLDIRPLRGNIDTRMGKVFSGELDAVVLAAAGLTRMGQLDRATELFDATRLMPAPAQGALAIECRADDDHAVQAIRALADQPTELCAAAERSVLATLEAGCTAPVAAHAEYSEGAVSLTAGVFALDGSAQLVRSASTAVAGMEDARTLGATVATELLEQGAAQLMAEE